MLWLQFPSFTPYNLILFYTVKPINPALQFLSNLWLVLPVWIYFPEVKLLTNWKISRSKFAQKTRQQNPATFLPALSPIKRYLSWILNKSLGHPATYGDCCSTEYALYTSAVAQYSTVRYDCLTVANPQNIK